MSDYLQRLVRRAVPAPEAVALMQPEVRPATSQFGSPAADPQADFELESEQSELESGAIQADPNRPQIPEAQLPEAPHPAGMALDRSEGAIPANDIFQPRTDPDRNLEVEPAPGLLDARPDENAVSHFPPPNMGTAPSAAIGNIADGEPARPPNAPQAVEHRRAQAAAFSEPAFPTLGDEAGDVQVNQIGFTPPASQPAPREGGIESGPGMELPETPQLVPHLPTPPDASPSQPETGRVVIGSLTVEVFPPAAQPQTMQPAVQVTRIMQPAPPRHNRSSKLRFGLGQM